MDKVFAGSNPALAPNLFTLTFILMKTRKEYLKEEGWVILFIFVPLYILNIIALNDFLKIIDSILISSIFWIIFFYHFLNKEYTDYRINELQKQIDELKNK